MYDRVWVIDSLTNNAHVFSANTNFDLTSGVKVINVKQRPNTSYYIKDNDEFPSQTFSIYNKSAAATADWTGNVWYQKYAEDSSSVVHVSGMSVPFTVSDFNSYYNIRKINDSFNMAEHLKSLAFPEVLSNNYELFDAFLPAIVGDGSEKLNMLDDVKFQHKHGRY